MAHLRSKPTTNLSKEKEIPTNWVGMSAPLVKPKAKISVVGRGDVRDNTQERLCGLGSASSFRAPDWAEGQLEATWRGPLTTGVGKAVKNERQALTVVSGV